MSQCKECRSAYHAKWYGKNREAKLKQSNDWKKANAARKREVDAKWRAANRELWNQISRDWRRNNPEELRAIWARWRENNPESYVAHNRRNNVRRRNAAAILPEANVTEERWQQRVSVFGNKCAYCGSEATKLEADHVKPLSLGGPHCLSNLRPACKSCNCRKHNKSHIEWLSSLQSTDGPSY